MRALLVLLLFASVTSCVGTESSPKEAGSRLELIPEPDRELRLEYERREPFLTMGTDSLWNYLIFEKGGCLTGGQYIVEGQRDNKNCVMTAAEEWDIFFHRSQNELTALLLSKLPDTATTKIHTCPFFSASEGEVAVYALQRIYETNWFDFEIFQSYRDSVGSDVHENHQAWLQRILQKQTARAQLRHYWEGLAKN